MQARADFFDRDHAADASAMDCQRTALDPRWIGWRFLLFCATHALRAVCRDDAETSQGLINLRREGNKLSC